MPTKSTKTKARKAAPKAKKAQRSSKGATPTPPRGEWAGTFRARASDEPTDLAAHAALSIPEAHSATVISHPNPGRYPRTRTNVNGYEVVDAVCPKHPNMAVEVASGPAFDNATCGICGTKLVAEEEGDDRGRTTFRRGKAVTADGKPLAPEGRVGGVNDDRLGETGGQKLARTSGGDKPRGKRGTKATKKSARKGGKPNRDGGPGVSVAEED